MNAQLGTPRLTAAPFICVPTQFCWDCQIAKQAHEMTKEEHCTGKTIWRCGCVQVEPPFMTVVAGHVLIHEGGSGRTLASDWQGLCVDANNSKAFWSIGQDGGERSFTKLPVDVTNWGAAREYMQTLQDLQAVSSQSQKASAIWLSLAEENAVVTTELPPGFRPDWITMNATRPLLGDLVCENGPYLRGRWYACIDPSVEFAGELVKRNLRNEGKVVLLASAALQEAMAIESYLLRYKTAYQAMEPPVRTRVLTPFVEKLNQGRKYGELAYLMAEASRRTSEDALIAMAKASGSNPTDLSEL
jgi:hypothetical protein